MSGSRIPKGIGPRTARFLRAEFPRDRAKQIANKFRISVTTAQRWLDGHAPTTAHLEAMLAAWGDRFIEAVFIEAVEKADTKIHDLATARAELIKSLGYPADALEAARLVDSTQSRWTWIWKPSTAPEIEYSARLFNGPRTATEEPKARPKSVANVSAP